MSIEETVSGHYAHGQLAEAILAALREVVANPDRITPDDLAPVDEFHIGGREATARFISQLGFVAGMRILDTGSGSGIREGEGQIFPCPRTPQSGILPASRAPSRQESCRAAGRAVFAGKVHEMSDSSRTSVRRVVRPESHAPDQVGEALQAELAKIGQENPGTFPLRVELKVSVRDGVPRGLRYQLDVRLAPLPSPEKP